MSLWQAVVNFFSECSTQTLVIIVSAIVIICVIRYYSNRINGMIKDFDDLRKEDYKLLSQASYDYTDSEGKKKGREPKIPKPQKPKKPKRINKGEEKCREIFERLFNKPFLCIRPEYLKNDCTDQNMEIDGYNDDLKLGFEYQGVQHYKLTPYFHKDIQDFNKQVYRDNLKQELLAKNGIKIVYIPYSVEMDDLENFIKKELRKHEYYFE
jgi:hypothetical protein